MISTLSPPLRRAVSPYTGIVRSLEECLCATAEPPLFRAACAVGRGKALLGNSLEHLSGIGGTGLTRPAAAAAAVGEALERYSAAFVPASRIVRGSARELGSEAVEPDRFALFSGRQYDQPGFAFRRFTSTTRIAWVAGSSLPSGQAALLPAELVFLAQVASRDEAPIGYATSNGMACAETVDDALVRGLCEVLERDAFMIVWANRLSLPLLDVSAVEPIAALDRKLFASTGLAYAAVDLSAFHDLPSVIGVARAPRGFAGAVGVGAGTAPAVDRAWWKGLAEAFESRAAGPKLKLLDPERKREAGGADIVSFEDHITFHADHRHAAMSGFLDSSAVRTPIGSVSPLEGRVPADWVSALCRRVEAAGSSAYAVDVTSPDVEALGLTVTKVIAPELCAVDVPHAARFLGGRRLYEAAGDLGLREGMLDEADVNPDPHPFP